jgi:hypothetical protein
MGLCSSSSKPFGCVEGIGWWVRRVVVVQWCGGYKAAEKKLLARARLL